MIHYDGTDVHAPTHTLAWAASLGWVLDDDEIGLDVVRDRAHDLVLTVDPDRWLRNLTGPAPLAAVVRVDRDLHELTVRLNHICTLLIDAAEHHTTR